MHNTHLMFEDSVCQKHPSYIRKFIKGIISLIEYISFTSSFRHEGHCLLSALEEVEQPDKASKQHQYV